MAALDETITTLGDFVRATKQESLDLQLYVQVADDPNLIEVTEIFKVLPKSSKQNRPYLIFRCR